MEQHEPIIERDEESYMYGSASEASQPADTTAPPARLRLREVNGRFPTITLKPGEANRGTTCVLGADFPYAVTLPKGLGSHLLTHGFDHADIEMLHCAINWRAGLQPTLHNIPSAFLRLERSIPPHVRNRLGKRLDTAANVYISGELVDGSKELRIGDVLSFALNSTAPSFRVESAAPVLKATDGSPATFRLLELDNSLVFATVLPHLSLHDLAAFALTNAECADMVAQHTVLPERWVQRPIAINDALGQVSTLQGLMHTLMTKAAEHVHVNEDALWSLSTRTGAHPYPAHPYLGSYKYTRNGVNVTGLRERFVAHASYSLIPDAEVIGLDRLVAALASRMTPASLVTLFESMRTKTVLNAPWPSPYESTGRRAGSARQPRLEATFACAQALPPCRGAWTPTLLFRYGMAANVSGFALYNLICDATSEEGEAAFDAFNDEVEALWLAKTESVDEHATFLFGLYEREDDMEEHVDNLITRATSTPPLSMSLIGALTVRFPNCSSIFFCALSGALPAFVRCRGSGR